MYQIITHGTHESTQAVIITDIPLPIQISVISSQSHIKNIVPAVIIVIAIKTIFISSVSIIVTGAGANVFNKNIIHHD
ncbi:MAG: hypothetical protein LBU14_00115 [Candidatus Peribacteria bacterium]|jgi:PII-like signaling protein|nr:hypothetical protein [Candidatus Peribacteria bacterium]